MAKRIAHRHFGTPLPVIEIQAWHPANPEKTWRSLTFRDPIKAKKVIAALRAAGEIVKDNS